jgi:transposase-like protein
MADVDLQVWCERLSGEVRAEIRAGRSKKWRCPRDLRSRLVAYARACRERGEPYGDIAARLGLVESTLARWLRRDRATASPGFRSVAIVAAGEGAQETGASGEQPALRLVTPRGYSVEGLDIATAAYLLRVLG